MPRYRSVVVPDRDGTRALVASPWPLALPWALLAWPAFLLGVGGALLSAILLPGLERRRRWVTRFSRLPFRLSGVTVVVRGRERLPAAACIVVANHASYLDGIILQGFLPPRFSYVIKGEMKRVPVVGFLLRRIGARFVDRFSAAASRDARSLLRAADDGESLAFFPEGTFVREPGLGAFRGGAFAAAIRGRLPLVPVVIRGSRDILPAGTALPRRAVLRIDVLDALEPGTHDNSKALAAAARRSILAVLGEPDRGSG